jgi:hypothetical protein
MYLELSACHGLNFHVSCPPFPFLCSSALWHFTNAIMPRKNNIYLCDHLNLHEFCGTCSTTGHNIIKPQNTFEQKAAEL